MRLSAFLFLVFFPILAFVQITPSPTFTNYTSDNGLPSSEVYAVIQDRQGFMWFATDRGVARYNGYEFEVFTTSDGLLDDVVFELYEDHFGRIWFLSFNAQLCYYEKGKIVPYAYNHVINEQIIKKAGAYFESFYVDKNGTLHLVNKVLPVIQISKTGKLLNPEFKNNAKNEIYEIDGHLMLDKAFSTRYWSQRSVTFQNKLLSFQDEWPLRMKVFSLSSHYLVLNSNKAVRVYHIPTGKQIQTINYPTQIVYLHKKGNTIFVGGLYDGIHIYHVVGNRLKEDAHLLHKNTVTGAWIDDHDGRWFTTTENGVYYTPNADVLSINQRNGFEPAYVKDMSVHNNELIIGTGNKYYSCTAKNVHTITPFNQDRRPSALHFQIHDSALYSGSGKKIIDLKTGQIFPFRNLCVISEILQRGDDYFLFSLNRIHKISNNQIIDLKTFPGISTINAAISFDSEEFLLGTNNGLYRTQGKDAIPMSTIHPLFKHRVVGILKSKSYGYVIATRNAGILLYNNGKVRQISKKEGLVSNNISTIYIDRDEHIWVGTSQGLNKIDARNAQEIELFSTKDGLVSNEINTIECLGDYFFIGTKAGLSILNPKFIEHKKHSIRPFITQVLLNGKSIKNYKEIHITEEDEFIDISYLALYYAKSNQVEYRYRIKGSSGRWHYTKSRSIHLESFPDRGSYEIELFARTSPNHSWTPAKSSIKLVFHPPFFRSWPFRIGALVLIILLIYLGFKVRLLRYDKHIQQEISDRILRLLGKKSYLIIEIDKRKIRINQSDILYIQSFKDYCEINTTTEKYLYRSTMKNMEDKLPSLSFIRIHRSYIVRKDKIDSIGKDLVVINSIEIPVGRTYRDTITRLKNQFSRINA